MQPTSAMSKVGQEYTARPPWAPNKYWTILYYRKTARQNISTVFHGRELSNIIQQINQNTSTCFLLFMEDRYSTMSNQNTFAQYSTKARQSYLFKRMVYTEIDLYFR